MIYTVTLNPALDKTARIRHFTVDSVNRIDELRVDPGGKGINVSKVIATLGGESLAIALLGGGTGDLISSALRDQGISCKSFAASGDTRTNLKIVDPELDTHTDINEPGPLATDEQLDAILTEFAGILGSGDIVVLSGSLPRGAATNTYSTWVKACKRAGARVFLDADGDKLAAGLEALPYLVKPNEIELGSMLGRTLDSDEKVAEAARELVGRGIEKVVVSMGERGAIFATGKQVVKASSVKVPVGSTVGAGDAVVAALAYAEDEGLPFEDAARLAMATGAASVMQPGTQAADRSVVDDLIDQVRLSALE